MNILYIANHLNIGGITSYLFNLARGMKERGHAVYLASSGGTLLSKFTEAGITCIPLPIRTKQEVSPKILFSLFKSAKIIDRQRIDIVHSNSRTTQVLGCLLNKFKHTPHISTCHGFFKQRPFRRIFPCWGEKTIAISESVKGHLVKDFKLDAKRVVVIHTGVDIEKFRVQSPESRAEIKKTLRLGDGPVAGIVARLSEEKGHIYLIRAMKLVTQKFPDAQLLIVGDGRMKQGLLDLGRSLGLEGSIFFVPSVTDTKEALAAMDVFVLASLKEGLGIALMEAMAAGIAVIGSKVGGIEALIRDGSNGLLVEPADAAAISAAVCELFYDQAKRESFARNARDFISRNFSLEDMLKDTEKVYSECLDAAH